MPTHTVGSVHNLPDTETTGLTVDWTAQSSCPKSHDGYHFASDLAPTGSLTGSYTCHWCKNVRVAMVSAKNREDLSAAIRTTTAEPIGALYAKMRATTPRSIGSLPTESDGFKTIIAPPEYACPDGEHCGLTAARTKARDILIVNCDMCGPLVAAYSQER